MSALASQCLTGLRDRYDGDTEKSQIVSFRSVFERYAQQSKSSILDLLSVVSSTAWLRGQRVEDLDSRLLEAIRVTSPTLSEQHFQGISDEQMMGALNSAKGKYFEYLVVDRLNAGEQVGSIVLPPGYLAALAETQNQTGWDVRIVGPDGGLARLLQLKATDDGAYVKAALERYPDIEIVATSEVAGSGLVLDSGITEDRVRSEVSEAIDVMDDSILEEFFDYFSPLMPLAVVAATEGYSLMLGRRSLDDFIIEVRRRGGRVLANGAAVAAASTVGLGWTALPIVFVSNVWKELRHEVQGIKDLCRNSSDRMGIRIRLVHRRLERSA